MIFRVHTFVFLLFAVAITIAEEASTGSETKEGDIQPTPNPTPTPVPTTPAPTQPTTPSTTPTPTTPTPSTTTSTPPTKPTLPPTVPTLPPTTSTPAPPPTTTAPTTTVAPITTVAPTPPPKPLKDWVVKDVNGTICIVANMVLKINVPYQTKTNKSVSVDFDLKNVADAHANGTCGLGSESLVLTWPNVTSTFNFAQNRTDKKTYFLSSIQIDIVINNFTFPDHSFGNLSTLILKHNSIMFTLPMNYSYTCARANNLLLNSSALEGTVSGHLIISNAHLQAFGNKTDASYYTAMDCASTETPDIVPIAVGLILAGLVVVVLIAYLVGRRRAQSRGYLSM